MARIKGKAKGETDYIDGGVHPEVKHVLTLFRSIELWEQRRASAQQKRADFDAAGCAVLFDDPIQRLEREIGHVLCGVIRESDTAMLGSLARRLEASCPRCPVDVLDSAIATAWGVVKFRYTKAHPSDILADGARVSARELTALVREILPGQRFGDGNTGEKIIREHAKALGVRFLSAGRPRKTP
jgi:hypothetical protein